MQSQVLRYIRFFIFGCWGILLLLMLLYGPWMIQAKQITIPDISITNFMIRDTSSFFPMHQEAAEQLIGEGKAVLSATEAVPNKLPNMRLVVFLLLLFPLCTKVLRTRAFPDPSLSPTLRSLKERARSERIAAGILRHFLLHAIFRHGRAGMFAGNPGLRPESSLVPSFQ